MSKEEKKGPGRARRFFNMGCLTLVFPAILFGPVRCSEPSSYTVSALRQLPAAHTIALVPGRTSLRLAMVHDVIHERFTRHGEAWYQVQLARAEKVVAKYDGKSPLTKAEGDAFDLLGACLDKLGRADEAVTVLRQKLEAQQQFEAKAKILPEALLLPREILETSRKKFREAARAAGFHKLTKLGGLPLSEADLALYNSHANLGTFLAHASFKAARTGDEGALAKLELALKHLQQAVAINPGAHFGREVWQIFAIRHLMTGIREPNHLLEYDLIGSASLGQTTGQPGRTGRDPKAVRPLLQRAADKGDGPEVFRLDEREKMRHRITHLTLSDPCVLGENTSLKVPFDEPMLGIVGMWTLGGGANPHFSFAMAQAMERVGEMEIAWKAYERTISEAARFSASESVNDSLIAHCRMRQSRMGRDEEELRATYASELALGRENQKAYQDFEGPGSAIGGLGEGLSVDEFDSFFKDASVSTTSAADSFGVRDQWTFKLGVIPWLFLAAGFGAFVGSLLDG